MSSQKLWVQHNTTGKSFIDKISTKGCDDIADFLNTLYGRPLLVIPKDSAITLYQLRDGQEVEIDVGDSPADFVTGNSRKNPLVVKTTAIDLGHHSLTTVDLHMYAPKATKKFETVNVEIKSGKINVESLLKEYRWKRLYFLKPKTLLQYDQHGWSLNNAFISGNVYKLRYEIDDGYDESIGFSEAKIEKVEKHFHLCIGQDFLAEKEYPWVDIPNSLFEQLVLLRKRNSLFSENARRCRARSARRVSAS